MRVARIALAVVVLAVCFLASHPRVAAAQSGQIRFVNSERILDGYRETKVAMETYRRDVEGWTQEAGARKKEIDDLGREVEQQGAMLSDEKRVEREQDYQRKLADYDQFVQKIWGPDGLVTQRNEEILRPIIEKIQTAIAELAKDNNWIVFDAADGNILYADPDLDLTDIVVATLNSQLSPENP